MKKLPGMQRVKTKVMVALVVTKVMVALVVTKVMVALVVTKVMVALVAETLKILCLNSQKDKWRQDLISNNVAF